MNVDGITDEELAQQSQEASAASPFTRLLLVRPSRVDASGIQTVGEGVQFPTGQVVARLASLGRSVLAFDRLEEAAAFFRPEGVDVLLLDVAPPPSEPVEAETPAGE